LISQIFQQIVQLAQVTGDAEKEIADENEEVELSIQPMKMFGFFAFPIFSNPRNFAANSQRRPGSTCWNLWDAMNWANLCHKLGTDDSPGLPNPSSTIMAALH
jgi:hypothetical protein